MKVSKAIEILTLMGTPDFDGHTEDIMAARKLAIEAMERHQSQRRYPYCANMEPLSRETPEDE